MINNDRIIDRVKKQLVNHQSLLTIILAMCIREKSESPSRSLPQKMSSNSRFMLHRRQCSSTFSVVSSECNSIYFTRYDLRALASITRSFFLLMEPACP
jgi:hypothetical protein